MITTICIVALNFRESFYLSKYFPPTTSRIFLRAVLDWAWNGLKRKLSMVFSLHFFQLGRMLPASNVLCFDPRSEKEVAETISRHGFPILWSGRRCRWFTATSFFKDDIEAEGFNRRFGVDRFLVGVWFLLTITSSNIPSLFSSNLSRKDRRNDLVLQPEIPPSESAQVSAPNDDAIFR